jgi:CTP:molybdopterin cytidylyltransferase MocA
MARTTSASAALRPTALAANPIAGGPARNPNQPMVETAATPMLADTPGVEPAARNRIGTTTPSPAPIAANPASATGAEPAASPAARPAAAMPPPPRASATGPKRWLSRSPRLRLLAIASENAVYPSAATAAPTPTDCER